MKLNESLVFDLKIMLEQIPLDNLGEVDGSKFKAITMRRKVTQYLKEINKAFEERWEKGRKIFYDYQEDVQRFRMELDKADPTPMSNQVGEKGSASTKSAKTAEEKLAEFTAYSASIDEKLNAETKEFGELITYRKGKKSIVVMKSKDEVEFTLNDAQLKFVREKMDKYAGEGFYTDEDVAKVGEVLGM